MSLDGAVLSRRYSGPGICRFSLSKGTSRRDQPSCSSNGRATWGSRTPIDASVNILGSIHLLEAARQYGVRRFIYISTAGAAYGEPSQLPVSENCAINPITPYGISKHTIEHYLFTYSLLYGLDYVVLRYGNVYGPRQSSKGEAGVFAIFCEQMLAGKQPVIYGDGKKFRDYVYIEDAARANLLALEHGTGEIFNIASGVAVTDFEVFDTVRELLGVKVQPKYGDRRPGEIDKIVLYVSKAERLLTWRPQIALREGAKQTVEWFQQEVMASSVKTQS